MWIPFREKIDAVFQGKHSVSAKVTCASFVGAFFVGASLIGGSDLSGLPMGTPPIGFAAAVAGGALVGGMLALLLVFADSVRRRVASGGRVNGLLRLYFLFGNWSLLAWFISAIIGALAITIVVFA